MQLTLDTYQRLVLVGRILPSEGSLDEALICENIRNKVEINDEEAEAIGLQRTEQGGLDWDRSAAEPVEVTLTEEEAGVIRKGFELIRSREDAVPTGPRFVELYRTFQNEEVDS